MNKLFISYSDQYLNWQLGNGNGSHPTNPMRAKLASEKLIDRLGDAVEIIDPMPMPKQEREHWLAEVKSVHDHHYVDEVLAGNSTEWWNVDPVMGETALTMFAGTGRLVERVLAGEATVVFNPQGAKHHAQTKRGSGFCVFNDLAWAAMQFKKAGFRPLYIDWDIHAGDGTFRMLMNEQIPTISIHRANTFPHDSMMNSGSEVHDMIHEEFLGYSYNVPAMATDADFIAALDKARAVIDDYRPDVILVAAGADGYTGMSNLGMLADYTEVGFQAAANLVVEMANKHANGRVVIGGAGGYQPLDHTPEIWAQVVETIYRGVEAGFANKKEGN